MYDSKGQAEVVMWELGLGEGVATDKVDQQEESGPGQRGSWVQGREGQSVGSEGTMEIFMLLECTWVATRSLKPDYLSVCAVYSPASTDRNIHT